MRYSNILLTMSVLYTIKSIFIPNSLDAIVLCAIIASFTYIHFLEKKQVPNPDEQLRKELYEIKNQVSKLMVNKLKDQQQSNTFKF